MILMRKEGFGYCDILEDLLAQEGKLFHKPHSHQRLKSDKGSEIQGWTFPHGKSWDREDKLKVSRPMVFEQLLFLFQERLWPSEQVSRKSFLRDSCLVLVIC